MAKPLSAKQAIFIKEYLVDKNATQAAIRAGYSARSAQVTGSRMLTNAIVRAEIDQGLSQIKTKVGSRIEKSIKSKSRWVQEVAALAYSDITDMMAQNENGRLTMSMEEIKRKGLGRLIRKIKVMPGGKVEFELHAKLPAMELLAKHFGWIKDQVELSGAVASNAIPPNAFKNMFNNPRVTALALELAEATSQPTEQPAADGQVKGEKS